MKKNVMMRIASVLMVAVLLTTCAISGTFAKYVTKAEGTDSARVAKWGIVLTMEGDDMFAPEYEADDETFTGSEDNTDPVLSVRVDPAYLEAAKEGSIFDLVAPGTTNDGFKATIVGTPEVAVRYTLHIDADWTDVVLPAGEYTDFTKLVKDDATGEYAYGTFTLENDYHPIKWDITVAKNGGTPISLVEFAKGFNADLAAAMGMTDDGFSASDALTIVDTYDEQLATALLALINDEGEAGASNAVFTINDDDSIDLSIDFDPNRSLGFEFGLKWTWAFEQVTAADATNGLTADEAAQLALYDAADTWLGNFAAYKEFGELTDYADEFDAAEAVYTIGFNFTATATQID